jgi:hypothetical protein
VEPDTSVAFVFFRSTDLSHLERAWYSLSQQDFTGVGEVIFYDNNTEFTEEEMVPVLMRHSMPVGVHLRADKHGDPTRTHSWSVNRSCQLATHPLVLFMRSDYLLTRDCLQSLRGEYLRSERPVFVSGHCYQTAYDREAQPLPPVDLDAYPWRTEGAEILPGYVPGFCFHETDQDAGVWLAAKASMEAAGWMNEKLTAWGYQQSTFQRALRRTGTECVTIPRYLFVHQQHGFTSRDFVLARQEYDQYGGGL